MNLFTTGDVLELTGITARVFQRWCDNELVKPVSGGDGHGSHRVWSQMQVVGFVVAKQLLNSTRGCVPEYVGQVVEAFGKVDEAWLEKKLKEDGQHLATVHHGKPWLQTQGHPGWEWPDVRGAYEAVRKYAQR